MMIIVIMMTTDYDDVNGLGYDLGSSSRLLEEC